MSAFLSVLVVVSVVAAAPRAALADPAPSPPVPPAPGVGMAAGILVDVDSGAVLWSRNPDVPRPPASLTKVLTALVVLERANLDEGVTVTPQARGVGGARIYAETGWVMSVRDLLWGLLLQSGNDAAVALAQKVSPDGTEAGFARLMNERAAQLGVTHSSFVNSHGLDASGHFSTARDMALITSAALLNPAFAEMVATSRHEVRWGDGSAHTLVNHNKLLSRYPGTVGVKTGFTSGAGPSLISAVRRGDHTLVAVVLGAQGQAHYDASIALYEWGFANLAALLEHPEGRLPAVSAPAPAAKGVEPATRGAPARVGGLDVVQLGAPDEQAPKRTPLASLVGLAAAALAGLFLLRRPALRIARLSGGATDMVDATSRPPLRLGTAFRRSRPL